MTSRTSSLTTPAGRLAAGALAILAIASPVQADRILDKPIQAWNDLGDDLFCVDVRSFGVIGVNLVNSSFSAEIDACLDRGAELGIDGDFLGVKSVFSWYDPTTGDRHELLRCEYCLDWSNVAVPTLGFTGAVDRFPTVGVRSLEFVASPADGRSVDYRVTTVEPDGAECSRTVDSETGETVPTEGATARPARAFQSFVDVARGRAPASSILTRVEFITETAGLGPHFRALFTGPSGVYEVRMEESSGEMLEGFLSKVKGPQRGPGARDESR